MDEDLQTNPPWDGWYEWTLTAFYISYIFFEWMSLLWKLIPAHIYVSMIVLSWGLTASLQSVSVSYPTLIFLRVLLGIGEAGFTGIPFYLSFFFKREELAFRTAIFISGQYSITPDERSNRLIMSSRTVSNNIRIVLGLAHHQLCRVWTHSPLASFVPRRGLPIRSRRRSRVAHHS